MKHTFVILRSVQTEENGWYKCYQSIREYYPQHFIVIIDNLSNQRFLKSHDELNDDLLQIIFFAENASGELLPFWYFWKEKWSEYMIFLHDSMYLNSPIDLKEKDIMFWHFDARHGKTPLETEIHSMLRQLKNHTILLNTFESYEWTGCFGSCCILSWNTVHTFATKYSLFTLLPTMVSRSKRKCLERIIGILFFVEVNDEDKSYFGSVSKCPYFGYIKPNEEHKIVKWNKLYPITKCFQGR